MSVTLQAAVHLGHDFEENLRSIKSRPLKSVKQFKKVRSNGFWNHVILENWIGSTGNRWNSSGHFSQDSQRLGILDEIQKTMMIELKCEPEH